jgi:hypothetical protein
VKDKRVIRVVHRLLPFPPCSSYIDVIIVICKGVRLMMLTVFILVMDILLRSLYIWALSLSN